MFTTPSQGGNLSNDQFGAGNSIDQQPQQQHTEAITYQFPVSRYHTGHPVDQALGLKDIAHNITAQLKGETPSAGDILNNTASLQRGGS